MVPKTFLKFLLFLALSVLTVGKSVNDVSGTCEIPIGAKQHFRFQWPLVYKPDGELYTSSGAGQERKIVVPNGVEVLLSCGPNYLKNFQRAEILNVRCNGVSGNFSVLGTTTPSSKSSGSTEQSIKEYTCDLRVIEEVLSPVKGCASTATSFGYVDPKQKLSILLGEACYDTAAGKTLFAHVKLADKDSSYLQKLEKNYLTARQHPDGRYKIELFRGLHFDEIYQRIRTQLHTKRTPNLKMANFIDETLLSNAQFQAVKKLGWNYFVTHDELDSLTALKNDIKTLSANLDLDVYVGSHGVLTLRGGNGEEMPVYLHIDRFPVPESIWIVVKHQEKAVGFIINNSNAAANSVERAAAETSAVCRSVCERITWLSETTKQGAKEHTIACCSYEELKKSFEEVPALEHVNELLI